MNGLSDIEGFKIYIQYCMMPDTKLTLLAMLADLVLLCLNLSLFSSTYLDISILSIHND